LDLSDCLVEKKHALIVEEMLLQDAWLPYCYLLRVVDKEVRVAIETRNEEGENNINSKKTVDNVVKDEEGIFLGC
jgi:hypothetical protein